MSYERVAQALKEVILEEVILEEVIPEGIVPEEVVLGRLGCVSCSVTSRTSYT